MSFWLGSFASSGNPSLAWSMGNGGKGRVLIKFPFPLDSGWYKEQRCTKFRTFEHRKERKGFTHEFIVLRLLDGSVCRVERMGDPDARFDALSPHGSIAHDMIQRFPPKDINDACLDTSDVIVQVTLPYDFDLRDVLMICRAIHEGEKTRNYTLQVLNCYFFSLAIQVCLTRLVVNWEDTDRFEAWLSQVNSGILALPRSLQLHSSSIVLPGQSFIFSLDSVLFRNEIRDSESIFAEEIKSELQFHMTGCAGNSRRDIMRRINNTLWHSTIDVCLSQFIEDKIKEAVLGVIKKRVSFTSNANLGETSNSGYETTLLSTLIKLLKLPDDIANIPGQASLKIKSIKGRIPVVRQSEFHSTTNVSELDFKGRQVARLTRTITADLYQWIVNYLPYLVLWFLHTALSTWGITLFTPGTNSTQYVAIDEKFAQMAGELGYPRTNTQSDHERFIKEMQTLIQNKLLIWEKNPWAEMSSHILQHVSVNIPEEIGVYKPIILVSQRSQVGLQATSIFAFQDHILNRVEIQAKEVESARLGSAARIKTELKDTLSQVWRMVREDDIVTQQGSEESEESEEFPKARPLNVKDALAYLTMIKTKHPGPGASHSRIYNQFLDIMKDRKGKIIDIPTCIKRVALLFDSDHDLLQGFNVFLPPGYRIYCTIEGGKSLTVVVTPSETWRTTQ